MVPIPEDPEIALKYHDLKVMERAVHINVTLVVGDRIVHAKVNDLLNGVDLGRLRKPKKIAGEKTWCPAVLQLLALGRVVTQ